MRFFSGLFVLAAIGLSSSKLIPTPFGFRLEQCVREVPSGSVVSETPDKGVRVVHLNGTEEIHPRNDECLAELQTRSESRNHTKSRSRFPDGWLDNVFYHAPQNIRSFSGTYVIPQPPTQPGPYFLYYFIGLEGGDEFMILQPVLAWSYYQWDFTSYICCPGGVLYHANTIRNLPSGSTAHGSIVTHESKSCVSSTFGDQESVLKLGTNISHFEWADVTLEQYYVDSCQQYPVGSFEFKHLKMKLADGHHVSPDWYHTTPPTECDGSIVIKSPRHVTITHSDQAVLDKSSSVN